MFANKNREKELVPQELRISPSLMGVSQKLGVPFCFGGPQDKDCNSLGSIFGSPYLGKVSYEGVARLRVFSDFTAVHRV